MADLAGRTETDRHRDRLTNAFDAGLLSASLPADTSRTADADDDDDCPFLDPSSPDSATDDSGKDSKRWGDLAASVRVFAGTLLRIGVEEMEMIKAREASRMEAERRRLELELEMTQMLLKVQLQIASFLSQKNRKRKRKRVEEEDDSLATERNPCPSCSPGFKSNKWESLKSDAVMLHCNAPRLQKKYIPVIWLLKGGRSVAWVASM